MELGDRRFLRSISITNTRYCVIQSLWGCSHKVNRITVLWTSLRFHLEPEEVPGTAVSIGSAQSAYKGSNKKIVEKRSHYLVPISPLQKSRLFEELIKLEGYIVLRPWLGFQLSRSNLPAIQNGGQETSTSIGAVRQKPRAGSTFFEKKVFMV